MDNRNIKKFFESDYTSHKIFDKIISLQNLFLAWSEFKKGKEKKLDVQKFSINLEDDLFALHDTLESGTYKHSNYASFYVNDPKPRHIHKAEVGDRILHHAIVKIIRPIFERTFIYDSYSSRKTKGTHKANQRFRKFAWKLSRNNTKTVWTLKCDVKKFFDSVNHQILFDLIKKRIHDDKTLNLLHEVIHSFNGQKGKGIPLGNLTSQIFSNIYLNELDWFIKTNLKAKYYIRYADDFVILNTDKSYLEKLILPIREFLTKNLDLQLHSRKIIIQKWHQGTDFLGYVSFPHYSILRTKTKKRILRKIKNNFDKYKKGLVEEQYFSQGLQSYKGILKHCRGRGVLNKIGKITKGYSV